MNIKHSAIYNCAIYFYYTQLGQGNSAVEDLQSLRETHPFTGREGIEGNML